MRHRYQPLNIIRYRYALPRKFVFVSYPKSGRTWMRHVFWLVNRKVRFTHAGQGTGNVREIGTEFTDLQTDVLGRKNIFMSRNALDVAVSLYFQIHKHDFAPHSNNYEKKYSKLSTMERLPPEDMNEFVIYPLWGVENVCRFNRAWLDFAENKPQFFLLKYEDVSDSPKAAIDELCQFVVSDYDVDDLVRKTEFSAMRSIEQKGLMPRGFRHGDPESMKVRRGVVKGYSKYIEPGTVNQARRIASRYGFEI